VKHWDSDIEIISNPSQSSIEVLDEQARYNKLLWGFGRTVMYEEV